jgi:uncharacterized repeat protein (TIGR03803 family)
MGKLSFRKIALVAAVFSMATAIAAQGQSKPRFGVITKFVPSEGGAAGSLIQGTNGNFYGTADNGGNFSESTNGSGTVFEVTAQGAVTVLHTFCSQANCTDGNKPVGVMQAASGSFYGMTAYGGSQNASQCEVQGFYGCGTIFEITTTGQFVTLYNFCSQASCSDGALPATLLVQGTNGNLYAATQGGGSSNQAVCGGSCGVIFELTTDGKLATLYNFCTQSDCSEGWGPGSLILGNDGNFYGTTLNGGANAAGTFYQLTPTGRLTVVHAFNGPTEGSSAIVSMQAADGNFYGVGTRGGSQSVGTFFQMTSSGALTVLRNFGVPNSVGGGANPTGIMQATDGNFYGTTTWGGDGTAPFIAECPSYIGCGTLFQITPAGQFTLLENFCGREICSSGSLPFAPPIQATNGNIYGTTGFAGNGSECENLNDPGCGTVYREELGLVPFVTTNPALGKPGWSINILGNELTETTSVAFNGTPATFTVVSPTDIKATVPSGATSGTIQVTTPSGTLSSNVAFRVLR